MQTPYVVQGAPRPAFGGMSRSLLLCYTGGDPKEGVRVMTRCVRRDLSEEAGWWRQHGTLRGKGSEKMAAGQRKRAYTFANVRWLSLLVVENTGAGPRQLPQPVTQSEQDQARCVLMGKYLTFAGRVPERCRWSLESNWGWVTYPHFRTYYFPSGSDGKASAYNVGDPSSISRSGRSPGGGHGNPLQYSCLENPHGQRSLVGHSPRRCRVGHGWATSISLSLSS